MDRIRLALVGLDFVSYFVCHFIKIKKQMNIEEEEPESFFRDRKIPKRNIFFFENHTQKS